METPSITAIFSKTWAGAPAILRSRPKLYWGFLGGGLIAGALSLLVPANAFAQANTSGIQFNAALVPAGICYALLIGVAAYFILADAVRSIVPAFRMTLQVFVITLLLNMVYSGVVQAALYCLVIPAFYVAPKLWLLTPNFLLSDPEKVDILSNLSHAWRDTNNLYWPTLGFMILTGFVSTLIQVAMLCIAALAIQFFTPSAIVMVPLAMASSLFCLAFVYLGWINWSVAIRKHADALVGVVAAVAH
jgi:hypothetical protein